MKEYKSKKVVNKTRRANGEGSVCQQKNGKWTGKIWVIDPSTNEKKRKTVYGVSQSEVSKKMAEMTSSMSPLNPSDFRNKTFGELFKEWLLVFKKSAISPRTFESNMRNFRLHIEPITGNMKPNEVNSTVVQRVINEVLMGKGFVSVARKVKFLFNQFFEYAIDAGIVEKNPTTKIKISTKNTIYENKEDTYKAIPKAQRLKFIEALNSHELLKPLCMTMLFAGLRTGEALALKWKNIDFENKMISVRAGIVQVPIFDEEGNIVSRKTVIGDTKTACSVREVPLPDILSDALKDWRKCQWVRKELTGVDLLDPDAIVFSNKDGTVRTYSGTRMIFNKWKKRVGLNKTKLHFHMLRHTYSNIFFEDNENPKIIQALLGHKSVKTTLIIYNSIDTAYQQEAAETINKSFNKEIMDEFRKLEEKKDIPALKREIPEAKSYEEYDNSKIQLLEKLLEEMRAMQKSNIEM